MKLYFYFQSLQVSFNGSFCENHRETVNHYVSQEQIVLRNSFFGILYKYLRSSQFFYF